MPVVVLRMQEYRLDTKEHLPRRWPSRGVDLRGRRLARETPTAARGTQWVTWPQRERHRLLPFRGPGREAYALSCRGSTIISTSSSTNSGSPILRVRLSFRNA